MDDLLDLSPIEQELEALSAIYVDELKINRLDDGKQIKEIELVLHPATGDDTKKQFVRMNLVFQPSCLYPDEVPEIIIRNPRGLGEEEMVSLVEDMRKKAVESMGEVMLYTLIEMAKEALTEGNIPHCPCVVCLEHFKDHDLFHRTSCYHYFHNYCLHKYLEHSRHQIEKEMKDAKDQRHLNPEEEKTEVLIVCPVCRTPMDDDSLSVFCSDTEEEEVENIIIPPNIREQQKRMAELYDKQKAKGAIIDIEWERNKFLVNPDDRVPAKSVVTAEKTFEEISLEDNENKESSKDEQGIKSQFSDMSKGGASRNWDSDYDYQSKYQPNQRHHGEKYGSRHRDFNNRERKGNRLDHQARNNTFSDGGAVRHRENRNHFKIRNGDRMGKLHDADNGRDCLAGNANSACSNVSDEVSSISFVHSKNRRVKDNEGDVRCRGGDFGERRNREVHSEENRRDVRGRGRGNRGGVRNSDKDRHTRLVDDDRDRSERSFSRNIASSFSQDGRDFSQRESSRLSSGAYSKDGEVERRKDDNFQDDRSPRYRDKHHNRTERGGNGEHRRGRGRGGFRREEERGKYEDDGKSKYEDGARGMDSRSYNSRSCNLKQQDVGSGCQTHYSEKKYSNHGNNQEERQQDNHGHNQHRNYSRRGGRRNEFNHHDHDGRRGGYGNGGRGRGGRGGGGNRSDQRGGRVAGSHSSGGPGDEEDEDGQKRERDLKNLEINQRWRELNFGREVRGGQQCERRRGGFGVIDDDENNDDNSVNGCDVDYDPRHNPNYDGNLYTIASSDSEEDWGAESDPFTFERRNIRREQFDEYSKYKAEHLAYYAEKVEKRAEKQNSIRAEQQRIQREQQLKRQKEQRACLQQQEQVSEGSLSVLDRFKRDQEEKDKKNSNGKSQQQRANSKSVESFTRAESLSLGHSDNDGMGSSFSKSLHADSDYNGRKEEPLPSKKKVEGIKWVGVRDHDDSGENYGVDCAVGSINGNSAFDESWKRREEKEKHRQKQQGVKGNRNAKVDKKERDEEDELHKESVTLETRVRSRRRDRENESQRLPKNLETHVENYACYAQGDIVNIESCVSSNGITHVSSREENHFSSCPDNVNQASNLQRKIKCKKPLDLRKKPHVDINASNHNQLQTFDHNAIENLVEKFPSLMEESVDESTKQKSDRKALEMSAESNRVLYMVPKNDSTKGSVGDVLSVVNWLSAESECATKVPNSISKTVNSKCKSKSKPLDFRKGVSKTVCNE